MKKFAFPVLAMLAIGSLSCAENMKTYWGLRPAATQPLNATKDKLPVVQNYSTVKLIPFGDAPFVTYTSATKDLKLGAKNITTTGEVYAQGVGLSSRAADSAVVHNTGSENINGDKSFMDGIYGQEIYTPNLTLNSAPFTDCPPAPGGNGGSFNYIASDTGVKDVVRVCLKGADGLYSWNSIDPSSRALDSAVVHNTGAETIAGHKTFSSTITGSGYINGNYVTANTAISAPSISVYRLSLNSYIINCDSSQKGVLNYIEGSTGVKDTVQVCAKDASDVYAWRTIY